MKLKNERIIAYSIMIIFLIIGVVCYAAFPQKAPDEPIRIMLHSTAGTILFDHKEHASANGYNIDCGDCHHDSEDDEDEQTSCGDCHEPNSDEDAPKRSDAFHMQCIACHEDGDAGPVKCADCHIR
jgi:hypothetical protein